MSAWALALALTLGSPPRGKPVVPRLMAQVPFDARGQGVKNAPDLFEAASPSLAQPVRWLMVGVSSLVPLDGAPLQQVVLTVTFPDGTSKTWRAEQHEDGDVDWTPFWIDLHQACGDFTFTVKVRANSSSKTLKVACPAK